MKTIGFVISHKNNEKRRALVPKDMAQIANVGQLYFEKGYGKSVFVDDSEYEAMGAHVVSREEALACDVIVDVKLGAAGLIMAILGGALITPWMAGIIGDADSCWLCLTAGMDNTWDTNLGTSHAAVRASFIVPAICFAVVLAYSLIFRKAPNPNKKPVIEEEDRKYCL